jgi:hypothetical protein
MEHAQRADGDGGGILELDAQARFGLELFKSCHWHMNS